MAEQAAIEEFFQCILDVIYVEHLPSGHRATEQSSSACRALSHLADLLGGHLLSHCSERLRSWGLMYLGALFDPAVEVRLIIQKLV